MLIFYNRELATAGAWLVVDPERPNSENRKFRHTPHGTTICKYSSPNTLITFFVTTKITIKK